MKKITRFLSFSSFFVGIFFIPSFLFAVDDLSCLDSGSCEIGNEEPVLLSDFPYGCYGTDSTFTPVLIPENEPTIGNLFLVKLDPQSDVYNIILCAGNTPPVEFESVAFEEFFIKTNDETGEDEEVDFGFFLGDDYKGTFEISKLGLFDPITNTYPKYILLATGGGVQFIREEIRYTVAGVRSQEDNFEEIEDGLSVKMLPNLEFAVDAGDREQDPVWKSPSTHYNDECVLSDLESECLLEAEVKAPEVDVSDYIESSSEDEESVDEVLPEEEVVVPDSSSEESVVEPSFSIEEGDQFSYRLEAVDTDGGADITYDFFMIEKGGKSCVESEDVIFDEESETVCLFDDYFVYTQDDHTLRQKAGVILEKDLSPYVLKVTARELKDEEDTAKNNDFYVSSNESLFSGVYAADAGVSSGKTSTIESFAIQVVTPSEIVSSGEAGVAPPVVTSRPVISSYDDRGGQDEIVVQRLKNGIEFKTIGEVEEVTEETEVLFCPRETYFRYPENRGGGVSDSLFQDASPNHRAYLSLIDLAEQGIVNGDQQTGNARLDDSISRAEFVKIMTIAREDTLLLGDCLKFSNFVDVPYNAWFTPFVQNLEQKAIVKGYTDNRYRPEKAINLVEAYKIVALSFDFITLDEAHNIVHDQNIQWYEPYKKALEDAGVVPLWMKAYSPEQEITRGDMFALLATSLRYKDWTKALDWE